jgi:trimethylamine--corrinoid protein Co-methyltransferase
LSRRNFYAGNCMVEGFGLNVFSDDALDRIHNATLEVLWYEGVNIQSELALDIFYGGGCTVDRKKQKVYIPPHIVEDCIRSAPSTVLLAGRDPKNDIVLDGSRVNFCNFSKGVNVVDPYTGAIRPSTKQDEANVAILVDYLDQYDLLDVAVEARDIDPRTANLECYEAMVSNSTKHSTQSPHSVEEAQMLIDMAAVVAGGKDKLRERPITSATVCPTSPLSIAPETCEPIITYAKNRVPMTVLSMAMAGGTSPVTLAGTLVTHNAEVLSGIVLAQLTNKGTPNMYGSSTTIMDLRLASATIGCPELGMISAAVCKLAQYYKIPSYVAGT